MAHRQQAFPLASFLPGGSSFSGAVVGVLFFAVSVLPSHAQMHHVDAPERVTRAIGVYEWTGELGKPTAARLVPVSLFINNRFEDAGIYLARPVPFALDTGFEYYIEKAGDHEGSFDIDFARDVVDSRAQTDDNPVGSWYGYGVFALPAPPKPFKPLKPSATVATLNGSDDDSRPHMTRRDPPPTAPSKSPSAGSPSTTSSNPPADSDRPSLSRRPDSTTSTTTDTSDRDANDPNDQPTLRRRTPSTDKPDKKKKSKPQASVSGPADSLNDDPDRPRLHRGDSDAATGTPPLMGLPADMHQAIAVSDPANRDPHLFARQWDSSSDRAGTLAALQALARTRITAYLAANKLTAVAAPPAKTLPPAATPARAAGSALAPAPDGEVPPKLVRRTVPKGQTTVSAQADATPATPKPAAPKPATKPAATPHTAAARRAAAHKKAAPFTGLTLYNEQLQGYELSYGGMPTFVYTAASPVAEGGPVYFTLVVQRLPSGEYQTALSSITDATHLDRAPWLRLVDVVDPDDEHRASFLFEMRAQSSRQFALYRLVTAEAQQIFTTGVIE